MPSPLSRTVLVLILSSTLLIGCGDEHSAKPEPDTDNHDGDTTPPDDPGVEELDARDILFISSRDGLGRGIYVMDADGANPTRLTDDRSSDQSISWYPGKDYITFTAVDWFYVGEERDGVPIYVRNHEIFVMNADGSSVRNLSYHPSDDSQACWDADGTRVLFSRRSDDDWEIHLAYGRSVYQPNLTNNPANDSEPSWSPNGQRIAFTSDRDGNQDIYVMDETGSGQRNLTGHPARDHQANWSPDGSWIVFVSDREGNEEIFVMTADGHDIRNLTNNNARDWWPRWSPDGEKILFMSEREGNPEVFVMDADGLNPENLTNHSGWDWCPTWRPVK